MTQFNPRDRVACVPLHANGDIKHPDVEFGAVSSVKEFTDTRLRTIVFVKFDKQVKLLGWDGTTSQSCDACDLRRVDPDGKEIL